MSVPIRSKPCGLFHSRTQTTLRATFIFFLIKKVASQDGVSHKNGYHGRNQKIFRRGSKMCADARCTTLHFLQFAIITVEQEGVCFPSPAFPLQPSPKGSESERHWWKTHLFFFPSICNSWGRKRGLVFLIVWILGTAIMMRRAVCRLWVGYFAHLNLNKFKFSKNMNINILGFSVKHGSSLQQPPVL